MQVQGQPQVLETLSWKTKQHSCHLALTNPVNSCHSALKPPCVYIKERKIARPFELLGATLESLFGLAYGLMVILLHRCPGYRLIYFYLCICLYVFMCEWLWVHMKAGGGVRYAGDEFRWLWAAWCGLGELNLGPLEELSLHSTTELSVSLTLGVLGLVTGRFNQCGFLFMALRNAGFCSRCISPWPLPILLQCRWVKWVWNQTSPLSVLCQHLSPWFSCKSIVSSAFWGEWTRGLRPHTCPVVCGNAVSVSWDGRWSFWDAVSSWQHLQGTRWLEGFLFYLCVCVVSTHVYACMDGCSHVRDYMCMSNMQVHVKAWGWHQVPSSVRLCLVHWGKTSQLNPELTSWASLTTDS